MFRRGVDAFNDQKDGINLINFSNNLRFNATILEQPNLKFEQKDGVDFIQIKMNGTFSDKNEEP